MATLTQLQHFGLLIRERRGRMTATELGEAIGKSQSYVSAIENATIAKGKSHPITPPDDVLAALSAKLDIPISELHAALGRVDDDRRGPIESIVEEAGFSTTEMSEAEIEDLRDDVDTFVKTLLAKRKAESGRRSGHQDFSGSDD